MKIQPAVRKQTATIAIGVLGLSCVMLLVYLVLGRLQGSAVLGALWGSLAAILNQFLMGLSVQKATEKVYGADLPPVEEKQEPKEGEEEAEQPLTPVGKDIKKQIQFSYHARMMMLLAFAAVALLVPAFDPIAALLPLLFPRIVILVQGFLMKKEA